MKLDNTKSTLTNNTAKTVRPQRRPHHLIEALARLDAFLVDEQVEVAFALTQEPSQLAQQGLNFPAVADEDLGSRRRRPAHVRRRST
jgi:hypothetical protein